MHHGRLSLRRGIWRMPLRIALSQVVISENKKERLPRIKAFRECRPARHHTGAGGI